MKFLQVIHAFHYEPNDIMVTDEYRWINLDTISTIGLSGLDNPKTCIWTINGQLYYRREMPDQVMNLFEGRLQDA